LRRYSAPGSAIISLLFVPLTISRTTMPKLYVSTFSDSCPWRAYSGAVYPLNSWALIQILMSDIEAFEKYLCSLTRFGSMKKQTVMTKCETS